MMSIWVFLCKPAVAPFSQVRALEVVFLPAEFLTCPLFFFWICYCLVFCSIGSAFFAARPACVFSSLCDSLPDGCSLIGASMMSFDCLRRCYSTISTCSSSRNTAFFWWHSCMMRGSCSSEPLFEEGPDFLSRIASFRAPRPSFFSFFCRWLLTGIWSRNFSDARLNILFLPESPFFPVLSSAVAQIIRALRTSFSELPAGVHQTRPPSNLFSSVRSPLCDGNLRPSWPLRAFGKMCSYWRCQSPRSRPFPLLKVFPFSTQHPSDLVPISFSVRVDPLYILQMVYFFCIKGRCSFCLSVYVLLFFGRFS